MAWKRSGVRISYAPPVTTKSNLISSAASPSAQIEQRTPGANCGLHRVRRPTEDLIHRCSTARQHRPQLLAIDLLRVRVFARPTRAGDVFDWYTGAQPQRHKLAEVREVSKHSRGVRRHEPPCGTLAGHSKRRAACRAYCWTAHVLAVSRRQVVLLKGVASTSTSWCHCVPDGSPQLHERRFTVELT